MPEGYEIGLLFHFIGLFALGAGIAVEWAVLLMMQRSKSVQELRMWGELRRITGEIPVPAIASLVLLLSGGYLVTEFDIEWSEGWVLFSLIALLIASGIGGGVIGARLKSVGADAESAPDGAVPAGITSKLHDPVLLGSIYLNNMLALGIVWNMVMKPDTFVALLVLVVLGGVGAAIGYMQGKTG